MSAVFLPDQCPKTKQMHKHAHVTNTSTTELPERRGEASSVILFQISVFPLITQARVESWGRKTTPEEASEKAFLQCCQENCMDRITKVELDSKLYTTMTTKVRLPLLSSDCCEQRKVEMYEVLTG